MATARAEMHVQGSAEFSPDGLYRRRLDRWWTDGPRALICGANPSKAGSESNDPTIATLVKMITRLGYAGFTMVNASDRIETDSAEHARWQIRMQWNEREAYEAIVAMNLSRIRDLSAAAGIRIAAWGTLVPDGAARKALIAAMTLDGTHALYAFAVTKDGHPKHPLARGRERIPSDAVPITWRPALADREGT